MNYLFDMTNVFRKLDQIRNLNSGVFIRAKARTDKLRMEDRESEILTELDQFVREAEEAREAEIAANRERAENDRVAAHEDQVSRARSAAKANPLAGNEILCRVEASGRRQVRLHNDEIQVAPSSGLSLEDESYLIEFKESIAKALRQRGDWRTIAKVSKKGGDDK